jgi:hypothetical protein
MKNIRLKFLILSLSLFINVCGGFAQRKHSYAFEKGIVLADFSTSLGLYKERDFVSQRVPLFLGADFGVSEQLGFGAFAGWSQRTRKPANFLPYDINYYYYGARLSWHFAKWLSDNTPIKLDRRTVDVYATLWGGRNLSKQINFTGSIFTGDGNVGAVGAYLGARFYTMYRIGILVEIGAGPYGVMNLGISTKF